MCIEGVNLGAVTGASTPVWSTMDKVAAAGTAVSSAAQSYGARAAYRMQAAVLENNAKVNDWQAADAKTRGDQQAQAVAMKGRQIKGAQRAQLAANGVDLGEGSALALLTDTDYMNATDVNTAHDNANKEAWYFRNQAMGNRQNADLYQSRASMESPAVAAGTSLLTSAGKVNERWYRSMGVR